jgi:hypothetical protein
VKNGCSLAEYSKEGYGSKRAVLPMMMIIIISFILILSKIIFTRLTSYADEIIGDHQCEF